MKNIIKQLYDGQVYPAEDINPNDPQHREASEKYNEELEKFKEKLSPECIELLEKVQRYESDISGIDMFYGFKEGLRIGILMMYTKFNINHPPGYAGHSLSMSDVLELYDESGSSFHYCDRFGFKEIPFEPPVQTQAMQL